MRNLADTGISLPKNAEYLDFPQTDGNVSTWPTNTSRVVDHEGQVNYYEHVALDHSQSIRWRMLIGDAIGLKLNLPVGPSYVLRDFPDGYRLFDHNKGPQTGPRHDLYLFGPTKKRFRSVNEFIPHAIWLMGDTSQDCECKYCAKKTQREITASMSNILRMTPSQSPSPRSKPTRDKGKGKEKESIPRIKLPRPREPRAFAAVQRVAKPLKPSPGIIQQPMLVERNNDLRAIYTQTSMHLQRWFRDGEVVWCSLENPIPGPDGSLGGAIEFWPAVIEEIKLKTEPIPRNIGDPSSNVSSSSAAHATSSAMQIDSSTEDDTRGPMLENSDEPLPWTIRQSTRYKVQLLAVSHNYTIDDEMVLPYQAYVPPNDLITNMTEFPPEKLDFDRDSLLKFNPCSNPPPLFADAVSAFATALQIASIISTGWCLTDDYTVRYSIPAPPSSSPQISRRPSSSQLASSSSQPPPMTLQDAIESASRHNAQVSRGVTSVNSEMSERETSRVANSVLGVPPSSSNVEQTRFQGLWWGAERIWTDDFIRLKVPRSCIGPKGGPNLLPASGPGKSPAAMWIEQGRDPAELGAATRGLFLRLNGMVTVDTVNAQGVTKKEARVCGMLYELADEDWDDPSKKPATDAPSEVSMGPSQSQSNATASSSRDPLPADSTSTSKGDQPPIFSPAQENLLPQAPIGFRFRPVVTPGYEFVGAMGLIGGRYYPGILTHPKTRPRVQEALSNPLEEGGVAGFDNLWALEGLSGGFYNAMDPHRYKRSRLAMMQDADKQALEELQNYARSRLEGNDNDAMEVDM